MSIDVRRLATELAKSPDAVQRQHAASGLRSAGSAAAPHVRAMAKALREDVDPLVRQTVASALGGLGAAGRLYGRELFAAMRDRDAHVRSAAANAIEELGLGGELGDARVGSAAPTHFGFPADP